MNLRRIKGRCKTRSQRTNQSILSILDGVSPLTPDVAHRRNFTAFDLGLTTINFWKFVRLRRKIMGPFCRFSNVYVCVWDPLHPLTTTLHPVVGALLPHQTSSDLLHVQKCTWCHHGEHFRTFAGAPTRHARQTLQTVLVSKTRVGARTHVPGVARVFRLRISSEPQRECGGPVD